LDFGNVWSSGKFLADFDTTILLSQRNEKSTSCKAGRISRILSSANNSKSNDRSSTTLKDNTLTMSTFPAHQATLPIRAGSDAPQVGHTVRVFNPNYASDLSSRCSGPLLRGQIAALTEEVRTCTEMIQMREERWVAACTLFTMDGSMEAENVKLKKDLEDLNEENAKLHEKIQKEKHSVTDFLNFTPEHKRRIQALHDANRGNPSNLELALQWENLAANRETWTPEAKGRLLAETDTWHRAHHPECYEAPPPAQNAAIVGTPDAVREPLEDSVETVGHPTVLNLTLRATLAEEALNLINSESTASIPDTRSPTTRLGQGTPFWFGNKTPSRACSPPILYNAEPFDDIHAARIGGYKIPSRSYASSSVEPVSEAPDILDKTTDFLPTNGVEDPTAAPVSDWALDAIDAPLPPSPSLPSPLFYPSPRFSENESEHGESDSDHPPAIKQTSPIAPSTTLGRDLRRGVFPLNFISKLFLLTTLTSFIASAASDTLFVRDGFLLAISGMGMVGVIVIVFLLTYWGL
jgi:hypothetical protein